MARRPRIDLAGFHHVINRGVNRSDIFGIDEDYAVFLRILDKASLDYKVIVHDYCLMSNHFHIMVETELDNLSLFMKQVNANYAIYFNKRTKRSGHLWQGRFKSWFITDEKYLYTLIKYIENNPIKAKMIENLGEYKYSSYQSFIGLSEPLICVKNSIILTNYSYEEAKDFFTQTDYNTIGEWITKGKGGKSFNATKKKLPKTAGKPGTTIKKIIVIPCKVKKLL